MEPNNKRRRLLTITTVVFAGIGVVVFFLWFFYLRFEEYTDDAYVHGNMIELTPQVAGIVSSINAEETDFVEMGQIVIELDTTDYVLELEKAQANLGETVRSIGKLYEEVLQREADVALRESNLIRAQQDYDHRAPLVEPGAISLEEFEHAADALAGAQAAFDGAVYALKALEAMTQGTTIATHPLVEGAKQRLREAWVNLQRCSVRAPTDGFVAKRGIQIGEQIRPGDPMLAIIPLNDIWVEANYKEVQLSKMRIGQAARIKSDIYGHAVYYQGKVIGVGAGTGSVFSVLPPQNATGNWIKIVQRVPVRISLDRAQIKQFPLRLGMSLEVHVDLHDMTGPMLSSPRPLRPIYATPVYGEQEKGADALIQQIIADNAL